MNVNADGNHRVRQRRIGRGEQVCWPPSPGPRRWPRRAAAARRPAGRSRRPGVFAAVLAGTALFAAACGGGSHAAGSGATSGQLTAPRLDVFAQCMRSHGVPDFYFSQANSSSRDVMFGYAVPASIDPRSAQFQAGLKACGHVLGLPSGPPPGVSAAQLRGLLRAAECMRTHGYPGYPDPSVQNGGIAVPSLSSSIDMNSAQFQAAVKKCHPALPGGQSGG
jgi:hypothetical protein